MLERLFHNPPFSRIREHLRQGRSVALGGIWGSAAPFIVTGLGAEFILYITPTNEEAEEAFADLETFSGRRPILFPERTEDGRCDHSERLRVAVNLPRGPAFVVAPIRALLRPLPDPHQMRTSRIVLRVGSTLSPIRLSERLVELGYRRTPVVESPGEFAPRGGIIDVFSSGAEEPFRIEFFGDRIDSIRTFSILDQSSRDNRSEIFVENAKVPEEGGADGASLIDYLPSEAVVVLREPGEVQQKVRDLEGRWQTLVHQIRRFVRLDVHTLPVPGKEGITLRIHSLQRFSGVLSNVGGELTELARSYDRIRIYCAQSGEEERLRELLKDAGVEIPQIEVVRGRLGRGFAFEEHRIAFIPNHELFNRYRLRRALKRSAVSRSVETLLELNPDDVVVHLEHGIGRFLGMERLERDGRIQEFLALEYADGAKLYVPVANMDLVQKYLGGTETSPPLHRLGGTTWSQAKARAQASVEKLAGEMLRTQALRELELGIAYSRDTEWQRAFEAAFPYEETEDQLEVMRQIKEDMQSARPMDRLICGDVGYGKTELAMRAAFKAATDGRQVAVLAPTTVLAQQHDQTFRERMADYPMAIDVLSRFRTKKEQQNVLERLEAGAVDIVIGTHRLLQNDVRFKDLGLVIIDEEQRFGVEQKERFKRFRATVDVLTLTATPIPRTLHMSLLNIKDISSLATPPQDRLAIRTQVCLWEDRSIREAILRELDRGGQVFFVHNRVYNIDSIAKRLELIVPEAVFGIGHGRMNEEDLERTMLAFLEKKIDVLVSTTIIESGLDIPNANTILVNNADQFGLADLHQLRGRVGRYKNQAFAYFLLPRDRPILPQSKKRLKAIEEFSELGAGFKIALRDLEIRGVGNLLGREQHGHIAAIGYEYYRRMLERTLRRLKTRKVEEERLDTSVDLGLDAYIPERYIPDLSTRVEAYKQIARCGHEKDLEEVRRRLQDRFGPPPEPVQNLVATVRVKILARGHGFRSVTTGREMIVIQYGDRQKARALKEAKGDAVRIVDGETIHLALPPDARQIAELLRYEIP